MDVFAHALWTTAAAKGYNLKKNKPKRPIKAWLAAFFGVFPDFFAFTPAFIYMLASYVFPSIPKMYHPGPGIQEPPPGNGLFINNLSHNLYDLSHSLIIFLIVFGLVWLIFKRPKLEMLGWLVHILIDIPSHSFQFYPTPFLWPVSSFMIDGFRWGTPVFMLINYSLLAITYIGIFWLSRKKRGKI